MIFIYRYVINFDDFDIEEKRRPYTRIVEYIHKFPYTDKYSYNKHRFMLYNISRCVYQGHGRWGKPGFIQYRISNDEKQLIIENKILITNYQMSISYSFMSWTLDDLISELKVYDQKFLDYVSTH